MPEPRITFGFDTASNCFLLEATQFLPCSREEIFDFFADAFELERVTPDWLHFHVLTPRPIVMSAGTLLDYRLRVRGVPLRWQSRISLWEPPVRFVDEQLHGPYRRWYHEHRFEAVESGTLCHDRVEYAVPGGRLVNRLFVAPDLRRIFSYRHRQMAEIFAGRQDLRCVEK